MQLSHSSDSLDITSLLAEPLGPSTKRNYNPYGLLLSSVLSCFVSLRTLAHKLLSQPLEIAAGEHRDRTPPVLVTVPAKLGDVSLLSVALEHDIGRVSLRIAPGDRDNLASAEELKLLERAPDWLSLQILRRRRQK